jgi:hypothetical protein
MLETNIRIVRPGWKIYVIVRRMLVEGQGLTPDLLERLCSSLRYQYGLPAVRDPNSDNGLLVATIRPVSSLQLSDEDYAITARDSGEKPRRLYVADKDAESQVSMILERALLVQISKLGDLWTLDSPRIWYETKEQECKEDITVYRRYEVAALSVKDVGVSLIADTGTAFFTKYSLDYYFDPSVSDLELTKRMERFKVLSARQKEQKGTLLYDISRRKLNCYFEDAPLGLTCGTTGSITVRGKKYSSLCEYYRKEHPALKLYESTPAIWVSFRGLDRPQLVAANLVKARVMNENLPESLSSLDKIDPHRRKKLLEQFWNRLETSPLGKVAPGLYPGFWRPGEERILRFTPPELEFGSGYRIEPPTDRSLSRFRNYYRNRLELLRKAHCYDFNTTVPRTLHYAYPHSLDTQVAERFIDDIIRLISECTGLNFNSNLVRYTRLTEACEQLRRQTSGRAVLFVMNDEPAAYYDTEFNLPGWRIKRVTEPVLKKHYGYIVRGAWDKKLGKLTLERGCQRWDSFVGMNALDILQLLDSVPYRVNQVGPYEAQIVIDVGYDKRFFALSLLIARTSNKKPSFYIYSRVQHKPDWKHEAINSVLLKDEIIGLLREAMGRRYDSLESLLIIRDGNLQRSEIDCIDDAIQSLCTVGIVAASAKVDIIGIHKSTLNPVRLWDLSDNGNVDNPLEGSGVIISPNMVVLTSTGHATLTQGTADPLVIVSNGRCVDVSKAALSLFDGAQLNWSSPGIAQRLTLPLKRTDEELESKATQQIRRIR